MGLDPDNYDLTRPLATLEVLLRNSMDQLLAAAEEVAADVAAGR
jgi:hypothetical protein